MSTPSPLAGEGRGAGADSLGAQLSETVGVFAFSETVPYNALGESTGRPYSLPQGERESTGSSPAADAMQDQDFLPTASWPALKLRAELLRRARAFFDARGFLEVETPLLSADVVVDRHLDPIAVTLPDDPRRPDVGRRMWLQTSPEFCMKRLLAAGSGPIYQICKAFRAGEIGRLHNPEFTMLEWYRPGDDMAAGMRLLGDLAEALLGLGPAELVSYGEAFARYAGLDPHTASAETLRRRTAELPGGSSPELASLEGAAGLQGNNDVARDVWLDWLLTELVEPHLGVDRPTILYDYPASQAALARVRAPDPSNPASGSTLDPPVAERFELYVRGIELANGYHELLDPAVLRARSAEANRLRAADGKPILPEESRLLAAMEHGLPPSCGVALGFDRLVMIAAGATSLAKAIAFPIARA